MPRPKIAKRTAKNLTQLSADLFSVASHIPEELTEEYQAIDEALLTLSRDNITDEVYDSSMEKLKDLAGFLSKKVNDKQTVYDLITDKMKKSEKFDYFKSLASLMKDMQLEGSANAIVYPNANFKIGKISYDREAFRKKMFDENHWKKGEDDKIVDLIFDAYTTADTYNGVENYSERRFNDLIKARDTMRRIINTSIEPGMEKSTKRSLLSALYDNKVIDVSYLIPYASGIKTYLDGITDDMVVAETNESEKAEFLKNAKANGFNRPGDDVLINAIFDSRFNKDGKYNREYNQIHENYKDRDASMSANRYKLLSEAKAAIGKIPADQRSEAHKTALTEIERQFKEVIPVMEEHEIYENDVNAFVNDVSNKGFKNYYKSEYVNDKLVYSKSIYDFLYRASKGLGEDHPYVRQLESMRRGELTRNTEFKISSDDRFWNLLTFDELDKCRDLLQDIDTPEAKDAIKMIDSCEKSWANCLASDRKQKPFRILQEIKAKPCEDKIKAFQNALSEYKIANNMPKVFGEDIEYFCKNMLNPEELFCQYNDNMMQRCQDVLQNQIAGFIGNFDVKSPVYKTGIAMLTDLEPDVAREAKSIAEYNVDISAVSAIKSSLEGVDKAYFNHKNSPEYNRMVKAVNDAAKATSQEEYESTKTELFESAKAYLRHTGFGRASSFHDNAEMRRLCAYKIIMMTAPEMELEALINEGNALRGTEDKITAERLDKIVVRGGNDRKAGKEKTSAKELLKEDKENFKKEQKTKKSVAKNKDKGVNELI